MDIDIFQLPGVLRRRARYIVLSVVVCIAVALAYVLHMTPLFSSSAELILDPQGLLADSGSDTPSSGTQLRDQSGLDSQVYVVQSSTVLRTVVQNLKLTEDPFFLQPKSRAKLTQPEAETAAIGALRQRMTVRREGQSLILDIEVEHSDAEKAADIANAVSSVYLQQIDEARADATKRASTAFQGQASELRERVLNAELAVEKFKAENGLISTGEGGLVLDQQVAGLNEQLIAARGVEEEQQTIYEQTKKLTMDAVRAGAIPEALQSSSIGTLRDRYVQLLDKQAQLETNLGNSHPQVRAIRSQVENMREALAQEIDRVRQSMQTNYQRAVANTKALSSRLASLSQTSFSSSEAQIKMRQLESEADAVRALYKSFLNRAEELGQQQGLNTNNSRVITAAVPTAKSSMLLRLIILAAGALFGLAFGAGLAVLREIMGSLLSSRPDEPEEPGLSVIGRVHLADHQTDHARRGLLPSLRKARIADPAIEAQRVREIHAIVEYLGRRFENNAATTIIFAASDSQSADAALVPDIVQSLVDRGHDIRYAPGGLADQVAAARSNRPSLVGALGRTAELANPDVSRLKFQQLSAVRDIRHVAGRPTYSNYVEAKADGQDLTIINACGTDAARMLPALAAKSDGIVLISGDDKEAINRQNDLLATLEPWSDAILGTIIVSGDGHA